LIPLLFQNRFIIGYLNIIARLIIIIDLQINQCKVSINLLAFSLFKHTNSIKYPELNIKGCSLSCKRVDHFVSKLLYFNL